MKTTNKIEFSKHGYERFLERTNLKLSKTEAEKVLKKILRNGIPMREFTPEEKRVCLRRIKGNLDLKIKVVKYEDLYFFFNSKNTCITVYPRHKQKSEAL